MANDPRARRRSVRLQAYDYSQAAAYFITVCTRDRVMLFGQVMDCDVILRDGSMTWRIPRERRLPKQGGFETRRPYKFPDLCATLAKRHWRVTTPR